VRLNQFSIRVVLRKDQIKYDFLIGGIIFLSGLIGITTNTFNLKLAKKYESSNNPMTVSGVTILSPDNIYYLSPVENYLAGKGWRQSPSVGNGSYFRRTPGYPLLYYAFRRGLSFEKTLWALRTFQFILFLVSTYCVFYIFRFLNISLSSSVVLTLIYGCTPFFSSYTYFTLTESISPFLVIFSLFFLLKPPAETKSRRLHYQLSSFFLGYAIMTRPILGLLIPGILLYVFFQSKSSSFLNRTLTASSIMIIPFCLIGVWAIRNYAVTKEFVALEMADHPESLDRMKPEFGAFWNFTKCWAEDGSRMNSYHIPFYQSALAGDTSSAHIKKIIDHIPSEVKDELSEVAIRSTIKDYQHIIYLEKPYFDSVRPLPRQYSPDEMRVAAEFDLLTTKWVRRHYFKYYVLNPLKYVLDIVVHSNTSNLMIFQKPYRDNWLIMDVLRLSLAAIHIGLYFLLFVNLFTFSGATKNYVLFVLIPVTFIIFFVFYLQAIEQRYMLPVLPLILIGAGFPLDDYLKKLRVVNSFK